MWRPGIALERMKSIREVGTELGLILHMDKKRWKDAVTYKDMDMLLMSKG
jgi:threonine aldolase